MSQLLGLIFSYLLKLIFISSIKYMHSDLEYYFYILIKKYKTSLRQLCLFWNQTFTLIIIIYQNNLTCITNLI